MRDVGLIVQHHPSRTDVLARLLDNLPTAVVVADPEPNGRPDPWRTYRECLRYALTMDVDHVAILQDDSLPCFDFACHLRCAIEAEPEAILVLFLAAQPRLTAHAAMAALRSRQQFAPLHARDWMPAVAVSYPRAACESILEWSDKVPGRQSRSDDHMLGRWARETRARVLVTVPSLVQHPDDVPSVIGNGAGSHGRNPARVALHWDG